MEKKSYSTFRYTTPYLVIELSGIYILLPSVMFFFVSVPVLPVLWLIALICFWLISKDGTFDKKNLWRISAFKKYSRPILIQFLMISIILCCLVALLRPDQLFALIKEKPLLWLLIILLYPLISAYPQEILYRTFFFHRYKSLFDQKWKLITVNALLFGYMHILFHNWIAVLLTIGGGFIFAWIYERSHSTVLVSLTHALYGDMLFTLGLGTYFYSGTLVTLS